MQMLRNKPYPDHLQTERLFTRFLTEDDIIPWCAFVSDKEATAFFPDLPGSTGLEKSTHWIQRQLTRYNENRFGLQALMVKETNEFAGMCGLLDQEVDGITELEVGYHLFTKFWGKGYATEAAKRFMDHAFDNNLSDSIISIIDTANIRSQKVAERNGLTLDKATRWKDLDVYIYRKRKNG